jgi:deoxycytidine triphosphate deaminase
MIIVGANLQALIEQHGIISEARSFDDTSLSLSLDREIAYYEPDENAEIVYGNAIPEKWVKRARIPDEGLLLPPKTCVLGCSRERVTMPIGYFGMLQTKGSLARLFTMIDCSDGQIDPGYSGKITFEIVNLSDFRVRIPPNARVAQLFIYRTSTTAVHPYQGRYQGATKPTIALPET